MVTSQTNLCPSESNSDNTSSSDTLVLQRFIRLNQLGLNQVKWSPKGLCTSRNGFPLQQAKAFSDERIRTLKDQIQKVLKIGKKEFKELIKFQQKEKKLMEAVNLLESLATSEFDKIQQEKLFEDLYSLDLDDFEYFWILSLETKKTFLCSVLSWRIGFSSKKEREGIKQVIGTEFFNQCMLRFKREYQPLKSTFNAFFSKK